MKQRCTIGSDNSCIQQAVEVLSNGGLVIYPTETCYGVGVDATNPEAVQKLLQYKDRPEGKAISIAVADKDMASTYVVVNKTAKNIYDHFLPGPITVISESLHAVASSLESEDGSLGVRIPDYSFALQLLQAFGKPITATSANRSGKKTPYSIDDIKKHTTQKRWELVDLVLDAGELPHNPPSTVVDTRMNTEAVLREGTYSSAASISTNTPEETQEYAKKLMKTWHDVLQKTCVVFALSGDLGAGKTQFAKGVATALGITQNVTSPTFNLLKEYETEQSKLFHIDTWRMQEEQELDDLGFQSMIVPGAVVVVEWVEKVPETIKALQKRADVAVVFVEIDGVDSQRTIRVSSRIL